MSDRTCGRCGAEFDFPCHLERHINGKKVCKPKINIDGSTCEYCKHTFATKYTLINHFKVCKAKRENKSNLDNDSDVEEEDNNVDNLVDDIEDIEDNDEYAQLNNYSVEKINAIKSVKLLNIISKVIDDKGNITIPMTVFNNLINKL